MNLGPIKTEDIVFADVRGDRFYATVTEEAQQDQVLRRRLLAVESLTGRPIPARRLSAKQVIGHWRKSAQSKV